MQTRLRLSAGAWRGRCIAFLPSPMVDSALSEANRARLDAAAETAFSSRFS